jgi:hypothetical protein
MFLSMFSPVHHRSVCVCKCVFVVFVGVFVCVFVCVFTCVFVCMFVCVFVCINAGMPDCPASDQFGTGLKKTNDAGKSQVPDQAKAVRHLLVPYRTEIIDAGMPMPALVSSMPMPSYGWDIHREICSGRYREYKWKI